MIGKTYRPSAVEGRIYAQWEEAGAFRCGRPERRSARPYCIVIPPPNVTGLDFSQVNFIDTSASDELLSLIKELTNRGLTLAFARVRDAVRDDMRHG